MTGELRRTIFEEQYGKRFKAISGGANGVIVALGVYDQYVIASAPTVAGVTALTLPPVVEAIGREYYIELADAVVGTTVAVTSLGDDSPALLQSTLKADGDYVLLRSVGKRWILVSSQITP